LEKLVKKGDVVVRLEDMMGPLALARILNFSPLQRDPARNKYNKVAGKFSILNEGLNFKLQIPKELDVSKIKLDEIKNEEEIFKLVGLLTGWYAVKARGKEVGLKLEVIN